MNRVVLFDVMDTLVVDPYREMLTFFDCNWDELGKARTPGLWPAFERGEIDQETFLTGFFRDGRSFDRDAFLELFRKGYRWIPGMEALLEDLQRANVEMHVLSNYPCWYHTIEEKLGLSRYLPWTFVSCKTGLRKPDAKTFSQAAAALERPSKSSETIFSRQILPEFNGE